MKAKSTLEESVKRRVRAGRLLLAGKSPPEVARTVGAPRQTVYRWREVLAAGGIDALRDMSKGGRPARLGAAELSRLCLASTTFSRGKCNVAEHSDVGTNVVLTEVPIRERAWVRLGQEFPELFVPGFDFHKRYAQGLEASSGLPLLSEALIARGYTSGDVRKILDGNFLRVFGEAVTRREASPMS